MKKANIIAVFNSPIFWAFAIMICTMLCLAFTGCTPVKQITVTLPDTSENFDEAVERIRNQHE